MDSGSDLLSRAVSSQVPSALKSLTAVFGMGTGGTSPSLPPVGSSTHFDLLHFSVACRNVPKGFNPCGSHPDNCTNRIQYVTFTIDLIVSFVRLPFCPPVAFASFVLPFCLPGLFYQALESSPRPISINNLHALPHFQR